MIGKSALNKNILVVEDDNSIRRLIEVTLKREGAEVTSAEDGVEAMQAISAKKPDLIIADAMMPNMTGLDLCRVVKNTPSLRKIPFILLSGFAETDSNEHIKPDIYLMKDSRLISNLVEAVSKVLSRQH